MYKHYVHIFVLTIVNILFIHTDNNQIYEPSSIPVKTRTIP